LQSPSLPPGAVAAERHGSKGMCITFGCHFPQNLMQVWEEGA
jgi:hypothetical protein